MIFVEQKPGLNPYFIGLSILIPWDDLDNLDLPAGLNPYFIGLSILIINKLNRKMEAYMSQSLFYWIIYSYHF